MKRIRYMNEIVPSDWVSLDNLKRIEMSQYL